MSNEGEAFLALSAHKETTKEEVKGVQLPNFEVRGTSKPVIILRNGNLVWNALLDTGSERTILNYRNFKYIGEEETTDSNLVIKGINRSSSVKGEVKLQLSFQTRKPC